MRNVLIVTTVALVMTAPYLLANYLINVGSNEQTVFDQIYAYFVPSDQQVHRA